MFYIIVTSFESVAGQQKNAHLILEQTVLAEGQLLVAGVEGRAKVMTSYIQNMEIKGCLYTHCHLPHLVGGCCRCEGGFSFDV